MKKTLLVLLTIFLLLSAFALTSCNNKSSEPTHEHTYSTEWSSNDDYHWHAADCGHSDSVTDKSEHTWDDGAFESDGECSPDAVFVFTCTVCGATKETTKESHSFELVESKEATCSSNGYELYLCSFCKKENLVSIKATGHSISNPTSSQDPTCTDEGYTTGVCDNCNTVVTIESSPLGHAELEMNLRDEYCGSVKIGNIVCNICDEIIAEYGHSFVKTVSNATCTADGFIKYECQNCSYSYSEVQKSQGHITGAWQQESASTCSTEGTRALYCLVCGELVETISTPTLDHIYSSVISGGEIVYSCTSCSHSYSVAADTTKEITFESNGGSACAPISVNYGSQLELPRPTKEGFDFAGWFFDQDLSNSCPTTLTVAEDTTLYAAWNESRIESVSEEKTLYVDVPLSFEFTVITDIELTNDNLGQYVFVKDHNGTAAKIYIASQDGNKYTIAGEDYKEVTTYEVFILQALSFEKSTSNTMWFITDGEKTTSIKFMPTVKHLNETDIYSMIQSEEKVFIFLLDDKFNPDDVVVVHGASEEEIVLAMKVVSEKTINDVYAYEIITAEPEEVYEETNIFYSGELDISEMELSETLEEDLVAALVSSELYAQIKEANVIFASERSTNKVKFTPKEIKIKPKFSVSGTKLYVQYTVSSIFEKETGNRTEEFSVSLAISNTTTFNSDVWFHWVDNFSLVFGARNEFQIDIFATGEMSYENNVEAFKQAFNKAKNSGKWKEVTSENASSSNATKLGNVDIPLNGVTISIELASNFEFKATGEIGISVKVTTDMQFGIRNTSWSGFEFVRSFNTRVDSTFVVRGKLEASYLLELKIGVKFAGVIEAYVKVGAGPYAEVSGMFVVSGSSNGGFNATAGGLIEIGLKTELTIGVTAKIETRVLWWNIKVVVFDVKHSWDLYKQPLFKFGSEEIALYFENQDDSASKKIICGQTVNISDAINKNVVFQKVDKLETSVSGVDCKYYLNESYDGVTLSADGVLSYSHTNFNHGDEIYIKIKVAYGSIYKITTLRLELCHDARSVKYTPPTCTTDGNNAYVYCYNCECIITGENSIIPALGHSFSDEWTSDADAHWHAATCTHSQLTEDYENHTWNEGEITTAATCYSNGEMTYTCTVCNTTKTEVLDLLPHDFDETTIEPTCYSNGETTFVCSVCGETKKEILDFLPHDFDTDGICTVCKEGSPFTFEPITDTTCTITGIEEGKEIVELIIPTSIKGYTVTSISDNAFKDQSTITTVAIPSSVTKIGLGAFANCNSLTKLTVPFVGADATNSFISCIFGGRSADGSSSVPESLKTVIVTDTTFIGPYAFYNCSHITDISLPSTIDSIGERAFQNCSSLTNVSIENGVEAIGKNVFYNCSALTSITIPGTVTSISESAFANCTSLTNVSIENGVTSLDYGAFYNCSALTSINIPDSVTSIGKYAFQECSALTSAIIGKGVTFIDYGAFYNCSSLKGIVIPDSVETIGSFVFANCASLTSATIGNNVTDIGSYAFYFCSSLRSIFIPSNVTAIGELAFAYCPSLANATIEYGVASIGRSAFSNCTALTSIIIPDSVTFIGDHAFYMCTSLKSATTGNGITTIERSLFCECNSLMSVTIGKDITQIGDSAFNSCTNLTSIVIPKNVTSIGEYAFYYCPKLVEIYNLSALPIVVGERNENGDIGRYALVVHTSLDEASILDTVNGYTFISSDGEYFLINYTGDEVEITLPESYKNSNYHVAKFAFSYRNGITKITVPAGVEFIGDYAFYSCSSLESIHFGSTMYSFGDRALAKCTSLVSITVDESNQWHKSIDGDLYSKDGTNLICYAIGKTSTHFDVPDGVDRIMNNAFDSCTSLTSVTIPDSVIIIYNGAFANCTSLTSVDLGNGVAYMGNGAFGSCSSLTSITIPESLPTIQNSMFAGCTSLTSIIIPNSVTKVEKNAFLSCPDLNIYCEATSLPTEWDADWNFSNSHVYWYSESAPTAEGNYWHYVNGIPTIWE